MNQLQKKRNREQGSRNENENITQPRRESYKIDMHSISASSDRKHQYSLSHPRKEYYSSDGPISSKEVSPVRHKRRSQEKEELHGEITKIKPPTFDGEKKRGEDVESWLLGMRMYFHLYQYSLNLEARIPIYHLKGKDSIWWDDWHTIK